MDASIHDSENLRDNPNPIETKTRENKEMKLIKLSPYGAPRHLRLHQQYLKSNYCSKYRGKVEYRTLGPLGKEFLLLGASY